MNTFQFKTLQSINSWSQVVAAFRLEEDEHIRSLYRMAVVEAAKTHGMSFRSEYHSDDDALAYLRHVREVVQDDTGLIDDINDVITAINRDLYQKRHDAGVCCRWECPICEVNN